MNKIRRKEKMNFKNRMFFIVLLVCFLLGFMVPAVCAVGDEEIAQETGFKTIRVAMIARPAPLDPSNYRSAASQNIIRLFTSGLYMWLHDGSRVPDLTEPFTIIDPLTCEIEVRKGIYFHNGDPLTADDVIFTLTRMGIEGALEDGKTSSRRPIATGEVIAIEKIDDYKLRVKFEKPITGLQYENLKILEVMPKRYFEDVGLEGYLEHPIGVGPFKWVEGDIIEGVVLERYENYHGGHPGLLGEVDRVPTLDRVIIKYVLEPTTRVAGLMARDFDIIQGVPVDSIPLLEANPAIEVASTMGRIVRTLHFNVTKAPFNDKRVRKAIAYAINYNLIINQLYSGYSDPMLGRPFLEPFPGQAGFKREVIEHLLYEYNPEKSKTLLTEAGVSGLSIIIDTNVGLSEEAQVIAQMLGDIGIDASVRVWEPAVIMEEFKKGTRDIYLHDIGQSGRSPEGTYSSAGTGGVFNYSGYSNPTYDDLMEKAIPMEDGPERQALFMEAYEIFMDEIPSLWMHTPDIVEAYRSNVKNFIPHPLGRLKLHRVDIE
jgi:peptide/nickel transport system substrate-binding protein